MEKPKSLFATNTFRYATITLASTLLTVAITCVYDQRHFDKNDALTVLTALTGYALALSGRSQNTPVYTPDYLPGDNKSDLEQ